MPRDSGNLNEGKNWQEHYPDSEDEFMSNMPDYLVLPLRITFFLDAIKNGDHLTRRSYSGILIYINHALIIWYSKRQNTAEAFSFVSEIICGHIACEKFKASTYKLRMFGMQAKGPYNIYIDNELVVKSVTMPQSRINNKHLST